MKVRTALITAALFIAMPALGQTPATANPPKPPAQHQPGVAAPPTQPGQAAKTTGPGSDDKIDPEKDAAIRQLMEITQTTKLGDNIRAYIDNQLRGAMSRALSADELPKFMDTFNQKLTTMAPTSSIVDAAVPIYARAFSMEDIKGLIAFYQSPLGQRVIKALPDVSRQSEEAGMQIEQKAAMDALHAMTLQYPQLEQMMQPPPDAGPAPAPESPAQPKLTPVPQK